MKANSLKLSIPALLTSLMLSPFNVSALDLDLSLNQDTALTSLTDGDWAILKAKARTVLKTSFDGENDVWKNPETGNSGVIKVLSTETKNDTLCRNTQFINTANYLTSITTVLLCQTEDGKWSEESHRVTTTDTQSSTDNSGIKSDMFNAEDNSASTEVTHKTLSQTSEFCRELAQKIEDLKGKPIRRNAAIEQHKAECRR